MKRRSWSALTGVTVAAVALAMTQAPASAVPRQQGDAHPHSSTHRADDLKSPMGEQQRALRKVAVEKLVKGEAKVVTKNGTKVIELKKASKGKKGKYVQYGVNREEDIFTILTEFGDQVDPRTGGGAGPAHNQIAAPDRSVDNSTYWVNDFNRQHYLDMMFNGNENGESFRDFYLKQSNGRFLAKGDVSDWVTVPYNEARYGHNPVKGDGTSEADGYWNYIKDTANAWYADQKAQGETDAEIATYLKQFDKVDRYDYDGDGNFNEPDGYIDHFQAIHAGEGEEAGGGAQGEDAIWSHRWYAFSTDQGKTGPAGNLLGGVQLGDSDIWIGDYTTEPENGGLGVFSHEFGHDLGLPDLYDTAGGDNGTGFWTLMSSGSWMNHGKNDIGTTPDYMGAWSKLQLGWLDYKTVNYGDDQSVKLGPADRDRPDKPQALLVNLPDKTVNTDYNTPHSGTHEWWGGSADGLNSTLTRSIDLTGATTSASLSVAAQYWIEEGYDYLYGEVSTDGGSTWTQLGDPVTGVSVGADDGWTNLTYDLSAYTGKSVDFRFRYATDGGVHYKGPFLDDFALTVDGTQQWTDDVESGPDGWTADGFTLMTGSTSKQVQQYYLAENRVYSGYDKTLQQGPYNFGWAGTKPNWVQHYPYQNGLLVWYVDGAYTDNNTSSHPGHGLVLPVDARSDRLSWSNGTRASSRIQSFDATFGSAATDAISLQREYLKADNTIGTATLKVPSHEGVKSFDDSNPANYYDKTNPMGSTLVAGSGTKIDVKGAGSNLTLRVSFNK